MTPIQLMARAAVAVISAKTLAGNADREGACNRAYYAMFDAARAALTIAGAPRNVARGKTHAGLRSGFSQYVILPGKAPKELGALLGRAEHFRLLADYLGDPIADEDVRACLQLSRIIAEAS